MLTALEDGVKGGKWFSLIDKVASLPNLRASFAQVKRNGGAAGVDHVTVEHFESTLEQNLKRLREQIRAGQYRPQAVRRTWIPKPGSREKRPLGIPTVRDRVVQGALRHVLEPIFEKDFSDQSFGFRPGRGAKDALRQVDGLLKSGATWVVDADWRHYFETIPHEPLMERVQEKVSDSKVLELLRAYLQQEVLETMAAWTPERGVPQGAVLSPLLSNLYLDALDHHLVAQGFCLVRYADDFVILCRSEREANRALAVVREWAEKAELELHPKKSRLVDATQKGGFDFLGYHFERGYRWPSQKSLQKLKDNLRAKTRRTQGHSLSVIVQQVNRTLRGWWEYFQHSHPNTFEPLDG